MNLNIVEWKPFYVGKIFRLEPTKGKTTDELEEGNDIPYIGAKHDTQGFMQMCKLKGFEDWVSKGNCIVFVQLGAGSAGYVNYMPEDFIGMNGKTSCGYIDGVLNEKIGMFLETLLCRERPKYSFGRSWTGDRLKNTIIKLPIQYQKDDNDEFILDKENHKIPIIDNTKKYSDEGYIPNWKFMEDYIKSLNYKPMTTSNKKGNEQKLNVNDWSDFLLKDIFGKAIRGTRITTLDRIEGNIPFITAGKSNQGVTELISNKEAITYNNAITIDMFGNAFYHNYDFKCDDNILVMKNEYLNSYVGNFIVSILCKDKYRYSYGRQYRQSDYNTHTISLPIQHNENGTPKIDPTHKYSNEGFIPDWAFMEKYIKSLPYGDRI